MAIRKKLASPKTIEARFNKSWAEIAQLTDTHTMAVQRWLSTRSPKVDTFKSQGIIANSTGLKVNLFNMALGCNYPSETNGKTIAAEVEALKKFYSKRNVPSTWWIGPYPQPADIIEQLRQHNLTNPRQLPAMVAPLPTQLPPPNPQVQVWQAANRNDLNAAGNIRRLAFRFAEGAALTYFEDMAEDWLSGDPARLYLAKVGDGPPAAIGALIMGVDVPGIYIMATLPTWSRQGLGQAIMTHMVSQATADGYKILMLTAGDMGYELYKKFGFEHIFNYNLFRFESEKQ